jgi:UDP-2-acetamido-2,6-beta-L-arabino-hexul-4-ose reductase
MIRIGITGQSGFVGTHLFNTLGLFPDKYERIFFHDSYFHEPVKLSEFVSACDTIVHLAALNRHNDPNVIYSTNIELVVKLLKACGDAEVKPHIIFSSSTQEERNNQYGRSKKEGRELFESWAAANNSSFTSLVIPNVFGPFGNPYYNSVIATFCHQLSHDEIPHIDVDGELKLIYVAELVSEIINQIELKFETDSNKTAIDKIFVPHTNTITVSELLKTLSGIKYQYFSQGSLPCLDNKFDLQLFNTFLTYIDHKSFFPYKLKLNTDNRGSFVETIKLKSGGQISFSTTNPGITRGNHFHTRKAERFTVIKGDARIELRRIGTDNKSAYILSGRNPSFVDMPVWFTHNITNIGNDELLTLFWINEFFNPNDPDTFSEIV